MALIQAPRKLESYSREWRKRRPRRCVGFYPSPWQTKTRRCGLRYEIERTKRVWTGAVATASLQATWPVKPPRRKINWVWKQPGFRPWPYFQVLRYVVVRPPSVRTVPIVDRRARPLSYAPGIAFMPQLQETFTTLAETTTTADPGTSGTSLAVTSRSLFPQSGKFYIVVQDSETNDANREVMRVTAGNGTGAGSFTVTRAQEGTTGVAHASGSYVMCVVVAKALNLSFRRCYTPDITLYSTATLAASGTDATSALQAAVDNANADGGGEVVIPGFIRQSGSVTPKAGVTIAGHGMGASGIVFDDTASTTPFSAAGTSANSTTLTSVVAPGDRVINFTSATGYSVGDWVELVDTTKFRGWVTRVGAIATNAVTMEEKATHDFATATTAVRRISGPLTRIAFRDLTIQNATGNCLDNATRRNGVISLTYAIDLMLERVEFRGISADTSGNGIGIIESRNISILNCKFDRCGDGDPTPSQNTRDIEIRYSTGIVFANNHSQRSGGSATVSFTGCGHNAVTGSVIGGPTDWSGSTGGTSPLATDNGGRGIKFEEGNNFFTCTGNIIHDAGFDGLKVVNDRFGLVSGNMVFAAHDIPLSARDTGNGCTDITINNNQVVLPSAGSGGTHALYIQGLVRGVITGNLLNTIPGSIGIDLDSTTTDTVVASNTITGTGSYGIRVNTGGTRNNIQANIIRSSTTNSIITTSSAGGNFVDGNIVDRAMALHANDLQNGRRFARLTSDVSKTTTPATDVTGLLFRVEANEVTEFTFDLFTSAGTGGIKLAITFPSGGTLTAEAVGSVAAGAITSERMTVSGTLTTTVFSTSNTTGWVRIKGTFVNSSTAGNVQLQYGSGTNGQTANVQAQSHVVSRPLSLIL